LLQGQDNQINVVNGVNESDKAGSNDLEENKAPRLSAMQKMRGIENGTLQLTLYEQAAKELKKLKYDLTSLLSMVDY
jgi:hypothetical protein